jgi:DNA-binding GntR family transcriptional regulator
LTHRPEIVQVLIARRADVMSALVNLPTTGISQRRTTPERVADVLREAILTGVLADGQELNQVALAQHFAISRVPVREALRQLQAEGLVRQAAHHRAVVNTLSPEHVMELFDVRVRLEIYMLERAMFRIDDEQLDRLEAVLAEMGAVEDHREWLRLNRAFHRALYERSGATYTLELADQISARTSRYLYLRSAGEGMRAKDEAHAEHYAILDALRQRDLHRASRQLAAHIESTRARVERFLARPPAELPGDDGV